MKFKKITQKEFDALIINDYGIKECPGYTDYSNIKKFGERCSFGEWCSFGEGCSFGEYCSFGEWCSFGEGCSFGKRCSFGEKCSFENGRKALSPCFIQINNIGSRTDGCTIYNFEDGIWIRSGCYLGNEEEFVKRLHETHNGNKHERVYLTAIELAKIAFQQ